ncbi:hypothetical protein ACWEAF_43535 [Streptomyces sp. NPDC005071]
MAHPAQKYYNPDLSDGEERALLRRNYLLLMTGQAALGLIGSDLLGLAVEPRQGEVVIHAAIRRETPEVLEELDDIAGDLDAFLQGGPEAESAITQRVHIGLPNATTWPGFTHALLYIAKT